MNWAKRRHWWSLPCICDGERLCRYHWAEALREEEVR